MNKNLLILFTNCLFVVSGTVMVANHFLNNDDVIGVGMIVFGIAIRDFILNFNSSKEQPKTSLSYTSTAKFSLITFLVIGSILFLYCYKHIIEIWNMTGGIVEDLRNS